mmetsp:Transcript_1126/g.1017  ORF Transcript_1126/g.1017 Transcript_1126/m.1017 type:complete len:515 (+) Transcript_1126:82-1626(+)
MSEKGSQKKQGIKLSGLVEETKKMIDKANRSPHNQDSVKVKTSNADLYPNQTTNWIEYRAIGKCPERRGFHASFVYNNNLYIHGGHDIREGTMDTLWKIDLSRQDFEWEKIHTRGSYKPGNIAYHTLTLLPDNKVILVGGSNLGTDNENIYELDLSTLEWRVDKNPKPEELTSIDEHTSLIYEDKLYIFGGNVHGFKSNKMFILDLNSKKWETKTFDQGPSERSSHSSVLREGKIYVFGGKDSENDKLGDLWVYDIEKDSWEEIEIPEGEGPISRSGHSTGAFKNFIIIYAGIHELTQELSDMYLYNVIDNTWTTLFEEEYSPVNHNRSNNSSFTSGNKRDSPKHSEENASMYKSGLPDRSGFSINIRKTQQQRKSRKSTFTMINQKLRLEKLIKKKRMEEQNFNEESFLTTPTSLSMKNSFLISSVGKTLEQTFKKHKKIDKSKGSFRSSIFGNQGSPSPNRSRTGKIPCFNPKPRDGHTGVMLNGDDYIVFGGDRHHMPFNDLASIDLTLEI